MTDPLTKREVMTLEWFTVPEVARKWRVTVAEVNQRIERNPGAWRRFGKSWRLHKDQVGK